MKSLDLELFLNFDILERLGKEGQFAKEKGKIYVKWAKKNERGSRLFMNFCSFLEKKESKKVVDTIKEYFA